MRVRVEIETRPIETYAIALSRQTLARWQPALAVSSPPPRPWWRFWRKPVPTVVRIPPVCGRGSARWHLHEERWFSRWAVKLVLARYPVEFPALEAAA
jgi:hypothetical protein